MREKIVILYESPWIIFAYHFPNLFLLLLLFDMSLLIDWIRCVRYSLNVCIFIHFCPSSTNCSRKIRKLLIPLVAPQIIICTHKHEHIRTDSLTISWATIEWIGPKCRRIQSPAWSVWKAISSTKARWMFAPYCFIELSRDAVIYAQIWMLDKKLNLYVPSKSSKSSSALKIWM